ncbi:hypothetical protein AN3859.2 [Aspergillus nidulans FGSC A4]|nr:hypothetical protein AN3859.2 [Aspergillus nidulans FGSC A4]|eukprot:XP_661463.1 hypothetical protein AN3859.2 [Aspergillus nidulans FGSC A4]
MHLTRTPLNPLYIPILTFIRTTDPFFIVAPPADPFNLLIAFHAHITHCKAIVDCVAPRTGFVPALGNAGNPGSRLATSAAEAGFKHGQTREVEGRSEGERLGWDSGYVLRTQNCRLFLFQSRKDGRKADGQPCLGEPISVYPLEIAISERMKDPV